MPKAVLTGLKKYPIDISVICAMLDSGGSAGRLRKDYNIVSPGDIRRSLVSLSNASPTIKNLFNFRFEKGELAGHNFANLLITALDLTTNDYKKTITEIKKILNVKHEVLPVTLEKSELCAVLENGKIISGETNIDIPKHNANLKIKKIFLKPTVKAYPKAIAAIKKADLIVIGPGDLYSSLSQILLVKGIAEAINQSHGKKIFICNAMTKLGETNGFSVTDFVREIEKLSKGKLDYVIFNTKMPSTKRLVAYRKEHPELLSLVNFNRSLLKDKKFVGKDLISPVGEIVHDSKKLAKIIFNLCKP